jgi:hypothetical protein
LNNLLETLTKDKSKKENLHLQDNKSVEFNRSLDIPKKQIQNKEKEIPRKISSIEEDYEISKFNKGILEIKERIKQNNILCNTPKTNLIKANKNNH